MRVVARGEKWCRPQPVGNKSAPIPAERGPNVFEKRFWLVAGGVVLLWVCLRVFDFTLLPPAYKGPLITRATGGGSHLFRINREQNGPLFAFAWEETGVPSRRRTISFNSSLPWPTRR